MFGRERENQNGRLGDSEWPSATTGVRNHFYTTCRCETRTRHFLLGVSLPLFVLAVLRVLPHQLCCDPLFHLAFPRQVFISSHSMLC